MRILSILLFSVALLFSVQLSPVQEQMLKDAGYVKASSVQTSNVQKEQEVENEIVNEDEEVELQKKSLNTRNLFDISILNQDENELKKDDEVELKRFASQFFNNKNKLNPYSIPTPSNYGLTYGDKLSLSIYGAQNQQFELFVNNNGKVVIPNVGEVKVIGLSFTNAKNLIEEEVLRAYPNSSNVLVDISEFSAIQVTVSGLVNAPGLYNLSSFSTIKDALLQSGGILDSGSYRNIYLKRSGKVIKVFDLYSLVRYGNTNSDIALRSGDVVLVNPISKEIRLSGEALNPAIYELKKSESFRDLFKYSSGLNAKANKKAISLKRYENGEIKVYTVSLNELYKLKPQNGDELNIFAASSIGGNFVKISGNIVASGEKGMPKDKKLSTLLKNELKIFGKNSYFEDETNFNYAILKNANESRGFNLKRVLDGLEDMTLNDGDELIVYKNGEFREKPYVHANGIVVRNDFRKYDFVEGMLVKDLFSIVKFNNEILEYTDKETLETKYEEIAYEEDEKKEQLKRTAFDENKLDEEKRTQLKEKTEEDLEKEKILKVAKRVAISVDKTKVQITRIVNNKKISYLLRPNEFDSFKLKAYDEVTFFEYSKVNILKTATIRGEVFIPGTYNITSETTINELVNIAGGFTDKVLYGRFELARYTNTEFERKRSIEALSLKSALDVKMKIYPDDEITIFPIANWSEKKHVEIKGFVRFPGIYAIQEGEKLSNVIARAGGFMPNAFIEGAVFTREEIKQLQQKRLQEQVKRLKSRVLGGNLSAKKAGENSAEKSQMIETVKMLEEEAKDNKPLGRVSLNLYADLARFAGSKYDISLKNKDTLYIPSINDTVSVVGEVLNQNTFIYDSELNADDYIAKAGGISSSANEDYIYVVKANGEAVKFEKSSLWQASTDVFKGDTIVVPLNIDTVSDIAFAKDVTSILYQLAVTAASLKTVGGL